ncbi:LLM class flavin-dependent oxidoreductase [Sorangium sp. So ce1153]|uniref:LLM class flavin-dependent oxidoreductase n=1 Tax=Sorangium sp. So ce1153 TaxID=3133333 RepID=UPI003F60DE64
MKLSVLDHSLIASGGTAADAFRNTVELARAAESLGYHRFWLAEHHGSGHFAGVAPEVMIARVASMTSRIRVGSGGVLLTHYSPFKVAEVFRLLGAMFPGRIDLGIGRSSGSSDAMSRALAYGAASKGDIFPEKLADLIAFMTGAPPAAEELRGVQVRPAVDEVPEIWSLGTGEQSAALAARHGLAFCFAHFFNPFSGGVFARGYRAQFQPSGTLPAPRSALGVYVICADTAGEARRLARTNDLLAVRTRRVIDGPVPSVEEADTYPYTPEDLQTIEVDRKRLVVGEPAEVKEQLLRMVDDFQVDELLITTICHDHRVRLRSYELLADTFALHGAA